MEGERESHETEKQRVELCPGADRWHDVHRQDEEEHELRGVGRRVAVSEAVGQPADQEDARGVHSGHEDPAERLEDNHVTTGEEARTAVSPKTSGGLTSQTST